MSTFLKYLGLSLLVWITTILIAFLLLTVYLYWIYSEGNGAEAMPGSARLFLSLNLALMVCFIGCIASCPVIILLVPNFYMLMWIPSRTLRFLYTGFSALLISALIIYLFEYNQPSGDRNLTIRYIIPFVAGALISSLLVPLKLILHGKRKKNIPPPQNNAGVTSPQL